MTPIEMVSVPLLKLVVSPRSEAELAACVEPLKKACQRCEINTIRRVAAFIAQMAHESDLRARTENLNYSVQALLSTFGRHRISAADAMAYGRTPKKKADQEAIANCIYGGEWGRVNLGNTKPGDGWPFRGRGPLQVTGRRNMEGFAAFMGMSLTDALSYADTFEGGIMLAAWFWEENDINRLADTPGVNDETRKINGGYNGLADRKAKFDALVAAMLKMQ
jgi:putative chitinase